MKSSFFALMICISAARAQYVIDWQTMDGGGGSGTAGIFAIDGTLGQIDAATGFADPIAFRGGYWSLVDEPLPLLRIFRFGGDLILAWPNPSPGFVLQATTDLVIGDWTLVNVEPEIVGDEKQVTWGPPTGRHFFRLRKP
jgi:hypothetical protein